MNKDEIIMLLQQQISFLQQQLEEANLRLAESSRKVDVLIAKVGELEHLLVLKHEQEEKQRRVIKGLSKIQRNESEKQTPPATQQSGPSSTEALAEETPKEKKPREKTNYGARRKDHYELETEYEDVYPEDPRYKDLRAKFVDAREVVRYIMVPMRFIKKVYRVHVYSLDEEILQGKAPDAPFLNSQYDGSFIAGTAQLRYIYSLPVERIAKLYQENGFDIGKGTLHGLLRKTETLFENLYRAMGTAVLESDYVAGDETYHSVLVGEKNSKGKGIKKGYVWVVTAVSTGLAYYFYMDGSRREDVILNYMKDYKGTFQSDGFSAYRKMAKRLKRLSCLQHVKRKYIDCGEECFDARVVIRLINHLYHKEHKHTVGIDGWTVEDNCRWRQEYAPPILGIIRKKLERLDADKAILPKSDLYEAVHYMLNEWEGIENIFTRGDYHLDNNLVERLNRYISLSRRNSLFFGSHSGAERAAMFYSLACSCRLAGVNFFEYISDVINKAAALPPNTPVSKYRELLPDKWKQDHKQ